MYRIIDIKTKYITTTANVNRLILWHEAVPN